MKKIYVCIILVAVFMVGIIGCERQIKEKESTELGVDEMIFDLNKLSGYKVVDDKSLDELLTVEYGLNDLVNFFGEHHQKDDIHNERIALTYTQVEQRFPVEVIRSKEYSVYKVREGGYYYVFWQRGINMETGELVEELNVDFSTYVCNSMNSCMVELIQLGVSTASDVRKLDPYVDFNLVISHGVHSYSYLDEEHILEIEYELNDAWEVHSGVETWEYDDLIVKDIAIIQREESMSWFRAVSREDLP